MSNKFYQSCIANCEMDCYYFGCQVKEHCEQFKVMRSFPSKKEVKNEDKSGSNDRA